jgi:hypothetical protein
VPLAPGFNLVTYAGSPRSTSQATWSLNGSLVAIYRWGGDEAGWQRFVTNAPSYATNLQWLQAGDALFVEVSTSATWSY